MEIHVVQPGDTLWALSRKYGVSINSIVQVNQLPNPNILLIGQSLVIPTTGVTHIVQAGESLWLIAKRYSTTVQAIVAENNITNPDLIQVGQVLIIPPAPKPSKEVGAYIANLDQLGTSAAVNVVQNLGKYLTYLCLASYEVRADGSLVSLDDQAIVSAAVSEKVLPCMVITNFFNKKVSTDIGHALVTNTSAQDTLIANVLTVMNSKGYKGLNIDFESILPADREAYNSFLAKIAQSIRGQGYIVTSALAPKTSATQSRYEAEDYPVHGQIMDFTMLMTYEWGWVGGPPTAISPLDKIRLVLDYAITAIPRNKIFLGTLFYAHDWTLPFVAGKTYAKVISCQDALVLAVNNLTSIQYDSTAQSPYFRYRDIQGNNHEVWFEDARSIQAKLNLVNEYNLRGVGHWELGTAFPQVWPVQENTFSTNKLLGL